MKNITTISILKRVIFLESGEITSMKGEEKKQFIQ